MNFRFFVKNIKKVRIIFCCKCRNHYGDNPLSIHKHINFFHSPKKFFEHKRCFCVGGIKNGVSGRNKTHSSNFWCRVSWRQAQCRQCSITIAKVEDTTFSGPPVRLGWIIGYITGGLWLIAKPGETSSTLWCFNIFFHWNYRRSLIWSYFRK